MGKKQIRVKTYSLPDAQVISLSRVVRNSFLKDREQFIKLDPDYGGTYGEDWLASIEAAASAGSDTEIKSEQSGKTLDVKEVMKNCRQKYQLTKRFVIKAFPNNKTILNEFGDGAYSGVRYNQPGMTKFMNDLYKVATKYSAKLIEANFTSEQIEEIKALAQQLSTTDEAQEDAKRERPAETQERTEKYNKAWGYTSHVLNDGKIIFADNPLKKKLYTLAAGGSNDSGSQTPPQNPDLPK